MSKGKQYPWTDDEGQTVWPEDRGDPEPEEDRFAEEYEQHWHWDD
jgi:hypothetical protein